MKGIEEINDEIKAQSAQVTGDLGLMSSATHSIEWLHTNGEYTQSNSSSYVYPSNSDNEYVDLEKYESYYLAEDNEVTEL